MFTSQWISYQKDSDSFWLKNLSYIHITFSCVFPSKNDIFTRIWLISHKKQTFLLWIIYNCLISYKRYMFETYILHRPFCYCRKQFEGNFIKHFIISPFPKILMHKRLKRKYFGHLTNHYYFKSNGVLSKGYEMEIW